MAPEACLCVPGTRLCHQMSGIFRAWGMSPQHAETVAEVLVAADLAGIDSHGATLLALYEQQVRAGKASPRPDIRVMRERGAVMVIDAGGGFGQVPGMLAVDGIVERARSLGLGAATVRNSNHYGAAGVYARRIADAGLIGITTSSVWRPAIVPTGGKTAMLGTNPIAFAAPRKNGRPFLLDMATSTIAIGKLKLAIRSGTGIPAGWAVTREGAPQRHPTLDLLDTLLLPLGGDLLHGGHKGYGLATMVEILSSALSGAALTPLRNQQDRVHDGGHDGGHDVGHFFLALDPSFFRDEAEEFFTDIDRLVDALRATPAVDPDIPVMVAGDPEYACEDERRHRGIPMPRKLIDELRAIAGRAGAAFLLETEEA